MTQKLTKTPLASASRRASNDEVAFTIGHGDLRTKAPQKKGGTLEKKNLGTRLAHHSTVKKRRSQNCRLWLGDAWVLSESTSHVPFAHLDLRGMLRALMRIWFGSLAIDDISMNNLPLIRPDVDVHTASTSSPSLMMCTFSWNVLRKSDRSRSDSPAGQGSPIVYHIHRNQNLVSRPRAAAQVAAHQPADSDTIPSESGSWNSSTSSRRPRLEPQRLRPLANKPPAIKRSSTPAHEGTTRKRQNLGHRTLRISLTSHVTKRAAWGPVFVSRPGLTASRRRGRHSSTLLPVKDRTWHVLPFLHALGHGNYDASMERLPVDQGGCSSSSSPAWPPDRPAARCVPPAHRDLSRKKDHQSWYRDSQGSRKTSAVLGRPFRDEQFLFFFDEMLYGHVTSTCDDRNEAINRGTTLHRG